MDRNDFSLVPPLQPPPAAPSALQAQAASRAFPAHFQRVFGERRARYVLGILPPLCFQVRHRDFSETLGPECHLSLPALVELWGLSGGCREMPKSPVECGQLLLAAWPLTPCPAPQIWAEGIRWFHRHMKHPACHCHAARNSHRSPWPRSFTGPCFVFSRDKMSTFLGTEGRLESLTCQHPEWKTRSSSAWDEVLITPHIPACTNTAEPSKKSTLQVRRAFPGVKRGLLFLGTRFPLLQITICFCWGCGAFSWPYKALAPQMFHPGGKEQHPWRRWEWRCCRTQAGQERLKGAGVVLGDLGTSSCTDPKGCCWYLSWLLSCPTPSQCGVLHSWCSPGKGDVFLRCMKRMRRFYKVILCPQSSRCSSSEAPDFLLHDFTSWEASERGTGKRPEHCFVAQVKALHPSFGFDLPSDPQAMGSEPGWVLLPKTLQAATLPSPQSFARKFLLNPQGRRAEVQLRASLGAAPWCSLGCLQPHVGALPSAIHLPLGTARGGLFLKGMQLSQKPHFEVCFKALLS